MENVRVTNYTRQHASDPIAFIGMSECNQLIGAAFVTREGHLVDVPDGTPLEQIEAAANALPEKNSIIATLPCPGTRL